MMKQMNSIATTNDQKSPHPLMKKANKVFRLFVALALVFVFIFYLCPFLDTLSFVKPLVDFVDEREIDAGALYYTEIEEFSDAEVNMRNTMEFIPR